MMYKGIVVEEAKKCYIIFTDLCEYVKVRKDIKTQIGSEIYFTTKDIYKESKPSVTRWVAIAASFLLIIILMSYNFYQPMVSNAIAVVSVDINPSMEFYIDESKRVLDIKPYNEEAKLLIIDEYIGQTVDKVINQIIDRAVELDYLSPENNSVFIAGGTFKEDTNLSLTQEINKLLKSYESSQINITYVEVSPEFIKLKESEDRSIGKMAEDELNKNPSTTEVIKIVGNNLKAKDDMNNQMSSEKETKKGSESEHEEKKIEKEAEHEEKKIEKEVEHEEKKIEKEAEHEEKKIEKETEHEEMKIEKEAEHEEKKIEKETEHEEKKIEKEAEHEEKKIEKENRGVSDEQKEKKDRSNKKDKDDKK